MTYTEAGVEIRASDTLSSERRIEVMQRRTRLRRKMDENIAAAMAENRNLTASESARHKEFMAELGELTEQLERSELTREMVTSNARSAASSDTGLAWRVSSEPRTYDQLSQHSYVRDLAMRSVHHDQDATERLQRHAQEVRVDGLERRDLSRVDGAGGEFVPPAWLMDQWISVARAGRATADLLTKMPMPPGTDTLEIPRVASGSTTAIQTADNAAVSETDITTDSVSAPVRTIAGQQDIALQVLEQSPVAFDQVIFADLAADYAEQIDTQVLNGSGASGQMGGILQIGSIDTTAYTDASPTVPELYPKVADSLNQVLTTRHLPADAIVMHPRRWTWMLASLDSSNRPFIVPAAGGPTNAPASMQGLGDDGRVGTLLGVPVYIDANVPITLGAGSDEDRIIVGRFKDSMLFEGAVRTRILPEVGSGTLTVRLQLYAYVAVAHRYSGAYSLVGSTGLVTPSF